MRVVHPVHLVRLWYDREFLFLPTRNTCSDDAPSLSRKYTPISRSDTYILLLHTHSKTFSPAGTDQRPACPVILRRSGRRAPHDSEDWLSAGHGAPHKHSKAPVDILPAHDAAAPKLPAHRGLTTLPNGDVTLRRGLRNPFSTLMKGGTREWRVRSVEDVLEAEGGDYGFLEYYSLRRTSSRDTALTDPRAALSYGTWSHLNSAWARWPDAAPAQFYPGTLGRADKDQRRLCEHRHRAAYHLEEPWRPEDMRTSTPLSSTTSSTHDGPPAPLAHQQSQQDAPQEGPQEGGRREGNRRGVGDLGASQPDLLTSHRAPDDGGQCDVVSPAPLSILPPTTRRAAQSETLPRKIRHNSKDAHAAHTLLARGRRWLHSASLGRADRNTDRGESEIMDYLSPVRAAGGVAPAGVVLDEYVGRAPRLVFRETSHEAPQRPVPPTPEWDTPSLSPPPSSPLRGRHHPVAREELRLQRVLAGVLAAGLGLPALRHARAGPARAVRARARPAAVTGLPRPRTATTRTATASPTTAQPGARRAEAHQGVPQGRRMRRGAGDGVEMPSFLTSACCIFGIHLPLGVLSAKAKFSWQGKRADILEIIAKSVSIRPL
ncbi:hypothetical protein C7M84_017355 [Penaeus vannamei]|uniref:Uncharacterized protein n=1 Tax=Penaeus vannamei TaxID=6689 RepID=A0A423SKG2_PENVA|nr:hypothetical protein C7M84_017355 [Penaeus vannamei]